jgi:hypothetical protein
MRTPNTISEAIENGYDGRGTVGLPMEALHAIIRTVPKPVIAKVRGYAIGGGGVGGGARENVPAALGSSYDTA